MKKTSRITAQKLDEQLKNDPVYLEMRAKKDREFKEKEELYKIEEKELVVDLKNSGCKINSVWDLINTSESYPKAIPVLVNHLSKNYSDAIKEGIVRALTVKEAKGIAGQTLIKELEKASKQNREMNVWVIKNALKTVLTPKEKKEFKFKL